MEEYLGLWKTIDRIVMGIAGFLCRLSVRIDDLADGVCALSPVCPDCH